ncbi:M949_RS01915 family surface polysaccharide biosynthesis protein [Pseudoduganella violaceinigra]|uniref:M949_RS01915 family surface polysaccharide biosynthesis protein n=1 Tax=Pseudoduganella violaceinigra TaxID=246602 RepID=UPI0012B602D8|nr:hypothetical protein [Pseudoduganella violaceinigra]
MKKKTKLASILLAAYCNMSLANTPDKALDVPPALKSSLAPNEQIVGAERYSDSHGEHLLIMSELDAPAKGGGKATSLSASAFNKNGTREWIIRDGAECPAGSPSKPSFFPDTATTTDLNKDGIAEVTVAYRLSCGIGQEPADIKVIMRQGESKFAIRGQTLVRTAGQPAQGGARKPDASLLQPENTVFLNHMTSIWNKIYIQKFEDEEKIQSPVQALVGDYNLTSSTTVPASTWGFNKAHISIRKLDDRHVVILFACEWKREPKAACDEYYYAQWRDGGVFMQDMNTDLMRMYFDPSSRQLTVIRRGVDENSSMRRDVFGPVNGDPADATLARRLKRSEKSSVHPENLRVFGPYNKWQYENNRIEFQGTKP